MMPARKVALPSIKTLTFYADELTTSRRTSPIRLYPFSTLRVTDYFADCGYVQLN